MQGKWLSPSAQQCLRCLCSSTRSHFSTRPRLVAGRSHVRAEAAGLIQPGGEVVSWGATRYLPGPTRWSVTSMDLIETREALSDFKKTWEQSGTEQVVQRGCAASITGGFQDPAGCCSAQTNLTLHLTQLWAGGWTQRPSEVLYNVNGSDSVNDRYGFCTQQTLVQ